MEALYSTYVLLWHIGPIILSLALLVWNITTIGNVLGPYSFFLEDMYVTKNQKHHCTLFAELGTRQFFSFATM